MKKSLIAFVLVFGTFALSFAHNLPRLPGTTYIDRIRHLQQDALTVVLDCVDYCNEHPKECCNCEDVYSDYIWTHPVFPLLQFDTLGPVSFSWNPQGSYPNSISVQLFNPERQAVQRTVFVVNGGDPDRRLDSGSSS